MPMYVAPTLVEALGQVAHDTARGFVFVKPDGTERFCSFREIYLQTRWRGAHFAAALRKGDRVALVIPDSDEFVLSFFGLICAGMVPVPIYSPQVSYKNIQAYLDTVAHIVQTSGAKRILTTAATRAYLEPILPRLPALDCIENVEDLEQRDSVLDVAVFPEDLAFLQFTSGSTSRPKGVVVTHANLAANSEAFMVHGLGKDSSFDKAISWLPLYHDMGLIGFVIGTLFTNVPAVFLPTVSFVRSPRTWLDTMHKHRGTITYAPNFAFDLVSKRLKGKDVASFGWDLSCMRITGCGAEPIQAKTLRAFAETLRPAGFDPKSFLPSYGMAEATLAISFASRGTGMRIDAIDKLALQAQVAKPQPDGAEFVSCGRAFPDHQVAIVDDKNAFLGDRQVGQIITRGPSVTSGYFQDPELTARSWRPGPDGDRWLYTGDLGYMADGELFICGRLKDIIIIRGRNYYPSDIEWAVSELPGVRRGNVVAFGVDVEGEEQLVVCAEAHSSDAASLAEAVQDAVSAQIGLTVYRVEAVPQGSLPRTSSGKLQRLKTKQMFLEGAFATARSKPRTESAA